MAAATAAAAAAGATGVAAGGAARSVGMVLRAPTLRLSRAASITAIRDDSRSARKLWLPGRKPPADSLGSWPLASLTTGCAPASETEAELLT